MYDIFYLKKADVVDVNIKNLRKRFPLIKIVEYYGDKFEALTKIKNKSLTRFFWVIDLETDYQIIDNFNFHYVVPEWDKTYVHIWKKKNNTEENSFGNVYLISKDYPLSKNEGKYFFFINKKEIPIEASSVSYDVLELKKNDNVHDEIVLFQNQCNTSMFWVLAPDCKLLTELTYVVPNYDKEYVHQWTASNTDHSRLNLIPKKYPISKKEANSLFFINKKEMEEELFKEVYDIIFVSYNEPNADENWLNLLKRFPWAKRIHGVKGIHNAHIQAAKLAKTSMFWIVDGDSQIVDDFNLDFVVNPWDKNSVFVWKSKNPVNNLIYGYGGVKLLPKQLTLDLDITTIDMTTSISKKFNSMDGVSNLTIFNTDPFNTWKSAFRECVKMSSKIIDGQIDNETENRLTVWCTVGYDKPYGEYSIKGALMGKEFGLKNSNNKSMLSKINDWEWLTNEFNKL